LECFRPLTNPLHFKDIDKDVRRVVDEAVKVATTEDVLPLEALYADLYANTPPLEVRGATADASIVQPYATTAELLKKLGRDPSRVR
jgi:hypothetical protein